MCPKAARKKLYRRILNYHWMIVQMRKIMNRTISGCEIQHRSFSVPLQISHLPPGEGHKIPFTTSTFQWLLAPKYNALQKATLNYLVSVHSAEVYSNPFSNYLGYFHPRKQETAYTVSLGSLHIMVAWSLSLSSSAAILVGQILTVSSL